MRHEIRGLVAVGLLLAGAALVVASYMNVFSPGVAATVQADRAGLLMLPDADVAMRDVRVGRVSGVEPDGSGGAVLSVAIDPSKVDLIPSDVTAQIISPTVFGPKYVDLVPPENPATKPLAAGAVVPAAAVQTEANIVFDNLNRLLTTVDPSKVNTALGALSTSLNGKGDKLGATLVSFNEYLKQINPSLPALQRDLQAAAPVFDTYADVSPELLDVVRNATTTSGTLVERQAGIDATLASLSMFATDVSGVLEANNDGIDRTLETLRPTTEVLGRYAPTFPCMLDNLNYLQKILLPTFGGAQPGLRSLTTFQPGEPGYTPDNAPQLGVDQPNCGSGIPEPGTFPRHAAFPDGSPPLNTRDAPVQIRDTPLEVLIGGDELGPTIGERLGQAPGAVEQTAPGGAPGTGNYESPEGSEEGGG
ncbi:MULTISPECIES: MCE family protein [unclassified Pseudonocardia]|uniref:MCE family protein n=1 Tax=unclassified Pseudonocardia TaxID=2619320 RepID=UPI000761C237|nr:MULTISPECIES: MCE family protein [unclassified Pseudonocardia]